MDDFETVSKRWAAAKYQVPVDAVVSVEWKLFDGWWSEVTADDPQILCMVKLSTPSPVGDEYRPYSFEPYKGPRRYQSEHRDFAKLVAEILDAARQTAETGEVDDAGQS